MAQRKKYNEETTEAQVKTLLHTVLENCKKEREFKALQVPLEDCELRVAYYTGLSSEYVHAILNNENTQNPPKTYSIEHRIVILKALTNFYKARKQPKFVDLYMEVKDEFPGDNIVEFRRALTSMGFDYRKTISGMMVAEDPELAFERYLFIKKIRKLRLSNTHICYIDERYIDKNMTFNKLDFNKEAKNSSENDETHVHDGFYFYHILSNEGLENYLITNKICKEVYKKWVFDIVIKKLKPGCAVVIDDHPIHGELDDEKITRYHSKADMISWLKRYNVPCSDTMCKADLYNLISRCRKPSTDYYFDRLLKAHDHEVLRLPKSCRDLSPLVLFWNLIQLKMEDSIGISMNLEEPLFPMIAETHKSAWADLIRKVMASEGTLHKLYFETESALENCEGFDVKNVDNHANVPEYFYSIMEAKK